LLHQLAPAVLGDDFTPKLAQRLAALSSAGINARSLLQPAVAESVLPDDHAAAAIWWRIARHPTPDIATAVGGDQPLTAPWTTTLADTIGADRASELQSSPQRPSTANAPTVSITSGKASRNAPTRPREASTVSVNNQPESTFAHGGMFGTAGVAQRFLAAANDPLSVGHLAGEGGTWGIALLAAYAKHRTPGPGSGGLPSEQSPLDRGSRISAIEPHRCRGLRGIDATLHRRACH
jgi:hypothetical protein